ncbi:MAG: FmdB family zinc ribbon protein [Thermoleophilaceae bacterium]
MPIYEFECAVCGARFEELVALDAVPLCPSCGGHEVTRLISLVAPTPRVGLRGGDARRSEAKRYDQRERRRERGQGGG